MALPKNAWEQARERFIEDLEEPERLMFAEASLENIFYSASAAQKTHQDGSKSRCFASKLDSLLAGIDQYGRAMDVFSQASLIPCLLWGTLRVIIHFQKYFTVLIDMLENIGDVLPRFQAYETLFSSSPRLIQSLSNAYLDIAQFCTSVKAAFKKAAKSVMNAKVLLKVSWRSVEQQFGALIKDFQRHRKSVEKEAELAHLIEAEKARALERAKQQQRENENSKTERLRLLSLLSSIQWGQQHSRILDMRHPGTGTWVLNNETFEQWRSATEIDQDRCLWCCGIPGSGKTILTASVINALSQEVDRRQSALAYFYCDYADQETLDASVILGTIIQQLLLGRPSIEDSIATSIRQAYGDGMRKPSPGELTKILENIILDYQCVYIVLDGVDEASQDTQEKLFANLATLSALQRTMLKLYFGSREISLMYRLFPSCLRFDISESRASQDIEHYVKASVQQRLHSLPIIVNYPDLEARAVSELIAKAQGLFLWVSLQMDELCDPSHSRRSFISALRDLPEGLTATYERIYQKIHRHSARQKALAERIFNWTVCARRPLRFDELKDAVAIDFDDAFWDRRKISAETDGKRFLHVCGNLVVIHGRDSTIRLAHHTVGKFLEQNQRGHSQTDAKIGHICLTYLRFSDFETQMIPVNKREDIIKAHSSKQADLYRIPELLGIGYGVSNFILGLYNRNNKLPPPDVNYAELMRRYQRKPLPESLSRKYCLLDYVTAHWSWHAYRFDPKMPDFWSRFEELVFSRTLPFDFKPWNTLKGPSDLPHLAMYLWALENSHMPLLFLIRDLSPHFSLRPYLRYKTLCQDRIQPHMLTRSTHEAAVNFDLYPDAYDWPVMKVLSEGTAGIRELCLQQDSSIVSYQHVIACALKTANLGLIESLLRYGAKLRKTEIDATNSLHFAIRRGNQNLVRMLLDLGADANSRLFQHERGSTPLYEAVIKEVAGGDEHREPYTDDINSCSPLKTIQLLVDRGADPNAKQINEETVLHTAVRLRSSFDTVQFLLDRGADPNAKKIGEETVLHTAISSGEAYVRLLLSMGANANARNDRQESILDLAVNGSELMVAILVEYGVDLDATDSKGYTTLLKAALNRRTSMVKTLIRHGANVHARKIAGHTILHHFRSSGDGTMRRLLELGVDANARDEDGATSLDFAVRKSDNVKCRLLLEFGAVHGENSAHPLMEAVKRGNEKLVKLLLRFGIDPDTLGDNGLSAISSAAEKKDKKIVIALLKAGANPNLVDESNVSPLSRAVLSKDKEVGKLLIEAGAKIQSWDASTSSPIYLAIRSGDVDMLKFLSQQGANIFSSERGDPISLGRTHVAMGDFLTRLGVPFITCRDDEHDP